MPMRIPPASKIRSRTVPSDASKLSRVRGSLGRVSQLVRSDELSQQKAAPPPLSRDSNTPLPARSPISVASLAAAPIKLRKLWNRAMPVLQCSNCVMSTQCAQYRMGYECAFLPFLTSHEIKTVDDLKFYMRELLSEGIRRVQTGMVMETLTGAPPGMELTEALNGLYHQFSNALQLEAKTAGGEGDLETPQNVLKDLFGDMASLEAATKDAKKTIEADNEDVIRFQVENEKAASRVQSTRLSSKQAAVVDAELTRDFQNQTKE